MSRQSTSLMWAKRVTGIAGVTAGVGLVMSLGLNLGLTTTEMIETIGAEPIIALFGVAAALTIIGSVGVLIGYGWGRWLSGPMWTTGLVPLLLGLVLGWGWSLLNRYVDLWGVSAQLAAGAEVPDVGWWPTVVIYAVSVAETVLVWVGAVRVLGSAPTLAADEPVSQSA